MNTNLTRQSLQYLPVDVGEQRFAIPLRDVLSVQQRWQGQADILSGPPINAGLALGVQSIDLCKLFWNIEMPDMQGTIIVVSTSAGVCALLIDHVYSASLARAEQRRPLPLFLEHPGNVFAEVVVDTELPILLLDCQRLVEMIKQVAPDYVVSVENAA